MTPSLAIVKDDPSAICHAVKEMAARTDALLTSGGAGRGDYDMVARALGKIGWKEVFHRIRIGPGKTVGFGLLGEKPVFILPGGPPSNAIAFLQVALPGLLALSGHPNPGLRTIKGRLGCALMKGDIDWTDFFFGTITFEDGLPVFNPQKKLSRLATIAGATAIAAIPEGYDHLPEGSIIDVQVLD